MHRPLFYRMSFALCALRIKQLFYRSSGFTLIELLLVMAIVAMVSAIAIPRYANSLARYRADATAQRIVDDLSLAQDRAMVGSQTTTVIFDHAADELKIPAVSGLDGPSSSYATKFQEEPYHAVLVSADFNGAENVTFDGFGIPDNGGGVVITVGDHKRIILVDGQTGQASVQ